jgi:uncharacterized membrane-anchored protein YjiN (DUF445 family)
MDIKKLLEPYSEEGRTVDGQIKWLLGKGITRDHIDKAILTVYDEIERGKVFENGHALDRYLLEVAQKLHKAELDDSVKKLEDFFNSFKGQWTADLQGQTRWQRIKNAVLGR